MREFEVGSRRVIHAPEARALRGPRYVRLKRWIDIVLVLLLLLLSAPLMVLIAIAIKLHSPGPILYRQQRVGKDGNPFVMLKFRSMRADSDPKLHQEHVQRLIKDNTSAAATGAKSLKLKSDPRITKLGKILRALSLDELPQYLNVLRGDMSLVGPRPPMLYEYELYNDWHKQRLAVLPGITGFWQVQGRNIVPFEEMVRMDLFYIAAMSPWLDLKIMLQTPLIMLLAKGGG